MGVCFSDTRRQLHALHASRGPAHQTSWPAPGWLLPAARGLGCTASHGCPCHSGARLVRRRAALLLLRALLCGLPYASSLMLGCALHLGWLP